MKRLGEKNLTAGRERWFAAALVLTYAFLYLQYMNVLWVRLTVVYYPWVMILLLIALLVSLVTWLQADIDQTFTLMTRQ